MSSIAAKEVSRVSCEIGLNKSSVIAVNCSSYSRPGTLDAQGSLDVIPDHLLALESMQ